jgi:probable rRNA maturation factor
VSDVGRAGGPAPAAVRRWAEAVLDGEGVDAAAISVTFLSGPQMRGLNRRMMGRDRATDVIAFSLDHLGRTAGDVYVCPSVARRSAREAGVEEREELMRLVIHGVLHVLGHDHPDGRDRTRSRMWQLQERYVRALAAPTRR